jgi:hypothetical protein
VAAWLTGLGATGPTCVQLSALQLHSLLWKGLLGALLLWHCGLAGTLNRWFARKGHLSTLATIQESPGRLGPRLWGGRSLTPSARESLPVAFGTAAILQQPFGMNPVLLSVRLHWGMNRAAQQQRVSPSSSAGLLLVNASMPMLCRCLWRFAMPGGSAMDVLIYL